MGNNNSTTLRDRTFNRLKQSISGEKSDGHGVFFYYTFPFFKNVTNVDLYEYFHNPKLMFDTQLEVIEKLERCGSFSPDEGPVAEGSALGGKVEFDEHGFILIREAKIETLEDVLKIKPGDPYGDNYMRIALESLEYMVQNAPKGIKVNPPAALGPFTMAAQLRGISQFCEDVLLDPDIAEALLDVCTQTSINFMKAAEKILGEPLHHVFMGDDISSFLSPNQYREWVMPTYEKFFKEFPNTQRWLHNDADGNHIIEAIAESKWQAWQYAPNIDPVSAAERSNNQVSLMGGLNPVEMQSKTAEETYDFCIDKLKSFGGNQKLVLGPGGSVNQIAIENLLQILRAADDYKV